MKILRPAILLVISFMAPLAWGAHSAELRHASRELDHAADTFFQTLKYRLGSGPVVTEGERFADAAYDFALRVDSYENPSVLWDEFQQLVDGFDYLAREFDADNYASYQSQVSTDFYAVENAMDRVGTAFRNMPRYRQTFSYAYSTWPWHQHRFWTHYHYTPPFRYYQPHIYVHNYYSSGRRHRHIARYRGRNHRHHRSRHYLSPRKYVRQRHFSPNNRNRHANNRGDRRGRGANRTVRRSWPNNRVRGNRPDNGQVNQNRRQRSGDQNRGRDTNRNRNGQRNDGQVRNRERGNNRRQDATRSRNGQRNDRQVRDRERSNNRRSWSANNRAPTATNGSNRQANRNAGSRSSNSRLAPPRNRDARPNNRNQNRRTGAASQASTRQQTRARNTQRSRPAANNPRPRAQRQANARRTPPPARPRSNANNNQNRSGSSSAPSRRSAPAASRNAPRGVTRRGRTDNR